MIKRPVIGRAVRWACECGGVGLVAGGLWWRVDPLGGLVVVGLWLVAMAYTGRAE